MNNFCKIFGHKMIHSSRDVTSEQNCTRKGCNHILPKLEWDLPLCKKCNCAQGLSEHKTYVCLNCGNEVWDTPEREGERKGRELQSTLDIIGDIKKHV